MQSHRMSGHSREGANRPPSPAYKIQTSLWDLDQPHNLAKSVTVEQVLPIQRVANQGGA